MEKSDVESVKYVDYKEAFLPFALVGRRRDVDRRRSAVVSSGFSENCHK
ncbi:MAG: hypothetical protein R2874_11755 [Desulfobacterales bacterium]